jgi:lipopolysaccharide transport system permease protein
MAFSSKESRNRIRLAGLVWTLVRTDFKTRYHGTLGGFAWALLKPIAMFAVLVFVFSVIFESATDYPLNLIIGLFLWDFFADGTKTGLISLHAKGYLLTKARFPSSVIVLTSGSNALITLVVFMGALIVFLTLTGRAPSFSHLMLVTLYLVALWAIVAGFALATSVLFIAYRDLNQIWEVATQAGFFVAPIIYPLGILPERLHVYTYLWPPTPVIQFSRAVLVNRKAPTLKAHLLLIAAAGLSLAIGSAIFAVRSRRAVERL